MSDAEFSLLRRRLQAEPSDTNRAKLRQAALRAGLDVPMEVGDIYWLGPTEYGASWCTNHVVDGGNHVVVTALEPPDNPHCLETCHSGRFECVRCPRYYKSGFHVGKYRKIRLVRLNGE